MTSQVLECIQKPTVHFDSNMIWQPWVSAAARVIIELRSFVVRVDRSLALARSLFLVFDMAAIRVELAVAADRGIEEELHINLSE